MQRSLKQETVFYGIAKYTNVLVTLLTSSVLSRILAPSEFGVVSIVTVFTAFFTVLSDMGLGTAVIQNKDLTREETGDIFTFSVYVALALGGIFLVLGIPISWFYGDGVYRKICALLSISVFFNAANIIPNAVLMKSKRFSLVGKRLILVSLATGAVSVAMALAGFGFYAIVFQSVFQAVFIFAWNYGNTRLPFRARFRWESIRKVRQYSTYQFFYSLVNYFARNLDNLLIGKVLGSVSLAYYDKGYRLMMYPVQNLTYVINPILHPVLSDYQSDRAYIYQAYCKVVRVLSLIGVFLSGYCFWASREIVLFFFGSQWEASIPVFRLLSLSVWPQLISTSAGSIYQSTGNTRLMFRSGMVHFGTTIAMILVGVFSGELWVVALLVSVSLYLRFFIDYWFLIKKGFGYSFGGFLGLFRKDMVIVAAMAAATLLLGESLTAGVFSGLLVKGLIQGAVYLASVTLTGQWKDLRSLFRKG